jgi:hypothetical protein
MSYFNNAFSKSFVGTKATQGAVPGTANAVSDGLLTTTGLSTVVLGNAGAPNSLGVGTYGFFNKDTYKSVNVASSEVTTGQSLILASASIFPNDKIGPFHGGYKESNKSKYINPKMVVNFYKVESATPEQAIVHIGNTNFQTAFGLAFVGPCGSGYTPGTYVNVPTTTSGAGVGLTVDVVVNALGEITSIVENQVGTGYLVADTITPDATVLGHDGVGVECDTTEVATLGDQTCEFEFLCGETYNLHLNLWGNPVLRVLNHDAYRNLAAYTGCCPEDAISPVAVDSTLVMINWANQIITSPYLKEFIRPVVFDETGAIYFATAAEAVAAGYPATQIWDNYVSTGHIPGALAGMRLIGAYVDTQFRTCTFQTSDYYNKDFVRFQVQLVDELGQPCVFKGLCVVTECCGFGGQGFGQTYLNELIQSEAYLQNKFSSDPRIREITMGNAFFNAIDKDSFYNKYVIQHVVPRYNNPSSVHDDDQYNLVIYVPAGVTATALETFMETWLTAAGNPLGDQIAADGVLTYGHTPCVPTPLPSFGG